MAFYFSNHGLIFSGCHQFFTPLFPFFRSILAPHLHTLTRREYFFGLLLEAEWREWERVRFLLRRSQWSNWTILERERKSRRAEGEPDYYQTFVDPSSSFALPDDLRLPQLGRLTLTPLILRSLQRRDKGDAFSPHILFSAVGINAVNLLKCGRGPI